MDYQTFQLTNGIRLIHQYIDSPVAHLGLIINTGSRDEEENEQGLAHFIEHVIFKGTKKRKAFHVLSRLEDVGGELNAYTTKEETAIYASFLNEYYHRTMELISDIIINSNYPEHELEKEKEVIIEEINSYKDSPSEQIYDDFEELIFPEHPFGRNILGTPEHLRKFHKKEIKTFIKKNYHTDQMVICSVGKIPFHRLQKLAIRYFQHLPENLRTTQRKAITLYRPEIKVVNYETYQSHCIIGNQAYDSNHPKRFAMVLLNNILGGQSMNSRLNLALRERQGLTYNIESNYTAYTDTGVVNIYFGTDRENLDRALSLVHKELEKLRSQKLGSLQMSKGKKQLIGQMAIAHENREELMLTLGKSYLLYNKVDDLKTVQAKIETITADDLIEIANEVFAPDKLSTLIFK